MTPEELKRLAGITDRRGMSTERDVLDRSKITATPGTDEWFKAIFPINDFQMPVGFRGRRK